jgi:hypothetical protein
MKKPSELPRNWFGHKIKGCCQQAIYHIHGIEKHLSFLLILINKQEGKILECQMLGEEISKNEVSLKGLCSKIFRNIVELSTMINNEEYVFYTQKQLDFHNEDDRNMIRSLSSSGFDRPTLVISRPIFDFEVMGGLKISDKVESLFYEDEQKTPEVTIFLDSLYRFKDYLDTQIEMSKLGITDEQSSYILDPTNLIEYFVAHQFYDCLSGGMPGHLVSVIRFIMERSSSINWDVEVYPGKNSTENSDRRCKGLPEIPDAWYTLRDFYKETEGTKKLEEHVKDLKIITNALHPGVLGFLKE